MRTNRLARSLQIGCISALVLCGCAGSRQVSPLPVATNRDPPVARKDAAPAAMCSIYAGDGTLSFCYDFDETSGTTLVDASGAGHNGTISASGVTYGAQGLATNSTAAETTDGKTGSMTAGVNPTSGSFSFSFFVDLHSNGNTLPRLASTGHPAQSNPESGWYIAADASASNGIYAGFGFGSGNATFGHIPLALNTPANVTLTYNASTDVANLCVGTTSSPTCVSKTLAAAHVSSGNPIVFGGGSQYVPANAGFDEAAYWQGTVLTSLEIDTIAGYAGNGPTPATPSPGPSTSLTPSPTPAPSASPAPMCSVYSGSGALQFCYDFDEASGTTLVDASGAGHNGTIAASGVTYGAAGLTTTSTAAETTDGSTGSMTAGVNPKSGSFSLSFFVDLRSNGKNLPRLASTGRPAHTNPESGWYITTDASSSNEIYADFGFGGGNATVGHIPLALNTPANVTLTYNATTAVATLCVGTTSSPVCASKTLPAAQVASGNPIVFGGGSQYAAANATFDEAGYWQGTVLTSAEISTIAGYAAAPSAASPTPSPVVTFNDYTTFGYDNQRDVFNPNSTQITPANLPNVHLAWQASLDDFNTQTQPVLATEIPGHAGVLFVGGGSGNVYAYDALSGSQLWTQSTGQETFSCENGVTVDFGIGGTVAYDPGSKSLYVAGNVNSGVDVPATNTLYHLDGASGTVLGQASIAPPVSGWSSLDFSHTAITLAPNGLAYVGTGATCDISPWRGRLAAISVPSMTLENTFYPVWNGTTQPWVGGGVWGWGGASLDPSGNVLLGAGNAVDNDTGRGQVGAPYAVAPEEYSGYGDGFVQLSSDLSTVENSNHPVPPGIYSGSSVDLDLNGTPTVFTPNGTACDPIAAIQGKSGSIYLYDTTAIGNGPIAQYQLAPSTYSDGFLGSPAYSPVSGLLYVGVPSSNESLYPPGMMAIDPGCGTPSVAWTAAFGPDSYAPGSTTSPGLPRSVPAVSAGGVVFVGTICTVSGDTCDATSASTSVVRRSGSAARRRAICCAPAGSSGGAVWALDASTGNVLNGGDPLIVTGSPLRTPPTIDGNWIFVLDNGGNLYGLTIDPSYPAIGLKYHASDARRARQQASWGASAHT